MISGHCLAQRRWGARQRGEGGLAPTPVTFSPTQLCQPRSSAHPSPCWLLPWPQDLQRCLHMLDYLSSQVLGTRGLTALLVISQSKALTHPQRGGQEITPGNKRTSKPHGSQFPRERQSISTAWEIKSLQEVCEEEPWKLKLSLITCHLALAKSKLLLEQAGIIPIFNIDLLSLCSGMCPGWEMKTTPAPTPSNPAVFKKAHHCSGNQLPTHKQEEEMLIRQPKEIIQTYTVPWKQQGGTWISLCQRKTRIYTTVHQGAESTEVDD